MGEALQSFLNQRLFGHTLQVLDAFFHGILPMAIVALLIALSFLVRHLLKLPARSPANRGMVLAFGVTGCLLGILIGASREPVVSAALPVIVTLVTGFLTYFMKDDTSADFKIAVPAMIIALAFGAVFGAFYGAIPRGQKEANFLTSQKLKFPIKISFCEKLSEKIAEGDSGAMDIFKKYQCVKIPK